MYFLLCRGCSTFVLLIALMISLFVNDAQAVEKLDSPKEVIMVSIRSTLTELNDFRPGYIYITVKNCSDSLLTIDRIVMAEKPSFITIKSSAFDKNAVSSKESSLPYKLGLPVKPGEWRVYPVYVASTDQVRPGDHLLLFNIFFHHNIKIQQYGSVLAEHKIKVKVFGEDEVLGALSNAVTFLMFPGFIMIVAFAWVWNLFLRGEEKEKFSEYFKAIKITDLRFWVIAITISLVMALLLYPWLTSHFNGHERNYLYGYGFYDIVWTWMYSIVIGFGFALIAAFCLWALEKYNKMQKNRHFEEDFSEDDDPIKFLHKMVKNGINEKVFLKVKIDGSEEYGWRIEPDKLEKKDFWIIPSINMLLQKNADDLYKELVIKIDDQSALGSILETIDKGVKQKNQGTGLSDFSWKQEKEFVSKPKKIAKEKLIPIPKSTAENKCFILIER